MKIFVIPALAAGLLMGTAAVAPAGAAPFGTMPVAAPESAVDTVRHTRKHRMHQRRMMKRRMYRGNAARYAPRNAGNARDPERPVYQQGQGNTTGGPRY